LIKPKAAANIFKLAQRSPIAHANTADTNQALLSVGWVNWRTGQDKNENWIVIIGHLAKRAEWTSRVRGEFLFDS
jgi:hypothetical protein